MACCDIAASTDGLLRVGPDDRGAALGLEEPMSPAFELRLPQNDLAPFADPAKAIELRPIQKPCPSASPAALNSPCGGTRVLAELAQGRQELRASLAALAPGLQEHGRLTEAAEADTQGGAELAPTKATFAPLLEKSDGCDASMSPTTKAHHAHPTLQYSRGRIYLQDLEGHTPPQACLDGLQAELALVHPPPPLQALRGPPSPHQGRHRYAAVSPRTESRLDSHSAAL
mmetsp:Transcript_39227/g.83581  ORF Transcript_39227/g.83581 Transcript_39227/m.83581 type:complete len:229 (+) Transcript_39227:363-1049(+)